MIMDKNKEKKKEEVKKESFFQQFLEWIGVIVAAVLISLFLNYFVIVNANVPTASMETTVMAGDRVMGFRLSYLFDSPQRGDIVIFKYPDDESVLFIKRIIGMPGDTVEIKDGHTLINGKYYEEAYLAEEELGAFGPYVVPQGHYFMMGDNRNNSADSRFWKNTYVARDKIIGKAIFKYFPTVGMLTNN